MNAYEEERELALFYECLPEGEYIALQLREFAEEHGRDRPDLAWIGTPYDTWEPNPFYDGRYGVVPHPEDDTQDLY